MGLHAWDRKDEAKNSLTFTPESLIYHQFGSDQEHNGCHDSRTYSKPSASLRYVAQLVASQRTCVDSRYFKVSRGGIDRPRYGRASDGTDGEDGHADSDS